MKNTLITGMAEALMADLQAFARIGEETLALATREHLALASYAEYQPQEFHEKRKTLLPTIEALVGKLQSHRLSWQQVPVAEREDFKELKSLFQSIQGLLMKIILLDRENQQAMLKRGLVPVKHLPSTNAQQPHYVSNLYRRNSTV